MSTRPTSLLLIALGLASALTVSGAVRASEISLLALHTTEASEHYGGAPEPRITHLVAVANDVLARSGVDASVRLLAIEARELGPVTDTPATLDRITYARDAAVADIPVRRDALGADAVVLFGTYAGDGYCGAAWLGGRDVPARLSTTDAAHAYAYVALDCGSYTLIHELGHLLGLVHSRSETPDGGTVPYAAGHGVAGRFVTVMAEPGAYDAPRLPYLSNPTLRACFGEPCGVDLEDPIAAAHAARAAAETAPQLAAFRSPPRAAAGSGTAEPGSLMTQATSTPPLPVSPAAPTPPPPSPRSPAPPAAGGGGGCAVGTAHDDPTLPFMLLTSLLWLLRRRLAI
ncbi:MAG: zinc-dependent metalloprotease family protein [Pseudomonadales bacterium]|jgi:hypothetical protein|nr:zinc-dependent metalloprotease family protein [Pseudomonadales bacterium]